MDIIEIIEECKRQYMKAVYRINYKFKTGIITQDEKTQMLEQAKHCRRNNLVDQMKDICITPKLGLHKGKDRKLYYKQYYNLKRDVILQQISQKETCNCGKSYSLSNKSKHLNSNYHNNHTKLS